MSSWQVEIGKPIMGFLLPMNFRKPLLLRNPIWTNKLQNHYLLHVMALAVTGNFIYCIEFSWSTINIDTHRRENLSLLTTYHEVKISTENREILTFEDIEKGYWLVYWKCSGSDKLLIHLYILKYNHLPYS